MTLYPAHLMNIVLVTKSHTDPHKYMLGPPTHNKTKKKIYTCAEAHTFFQWIVVHSLFGRFSMSVPTHFYFTHTQK